MIVLDDLLFRPLVTIADSIHTLALAELYDVTELENELKENQLLYELGERSEAAYTVRKQELEEELEIAEAVHEQLGNKQIQVRE